MSISFYSFNSFILLILQLYIDLRRPLERRPKVRYEPEPYKPNKRRKLNKQPIQIYKDPENTPPPGPPPEPRLSPASLPILQEETDTVQNHIRDFLQAEIQAFNPPFATQNTDLLVPEEYRQMTPIQLFNLFFPEAIIQRIVEYTNRNANARYNDDKQPSTPAWRDLTLQEFRRFLGTIFYIAFCAPRTRDDI